MPRMPNEEARRRLAGKATVGDVRVGPLWTRRCGGRGRCLLAMATNFYTWMAVTVFLEMLPRFGVKEKVGMSVDPWQSAMHSWETRRSAGRLTPRPLEWLRTCWQCRVALDLNRCDDVCAANDLSHGVNRRPKA